MCISFKFSIAFLQKTKKYSGNNLYDDELRTRLEEIGKDERRCAYVIMDKIRPASTKNYIVKDHSPKISDVISELGIFGVFISLVFILLK